MARRSGIGKADMEDTCKAVRVYLGLGSNLGDRMSNLSTAVERLSECAEIRQIALVYETEPVGYEMQPRFLNTAVEALTELEPLLLLRHIKGIEAGMGRKPGFRNAPRPIDIDILFYGSMVVQTPELTIPHPGIAARAFVLAPLSEIAFDLVHPVCETRVGDLLDAVSMDGVQVVGRLTAREMTV
jgi:2-amino-4-hydroxy-6-hydroxymethyldihydropteridine diphosphokinase